jgi:uncharacterized membrane protein YccC
MNAALLDTVFGRRAGDVAAWLRGATLDWLFVAKATFAVLLTGWLAMRFSLEQPGTAMMTVAIVIHPQSGMVVAKSFYRTLGTLVGCAAAFVIVGLFPQQRVPFLLSMALWIGLCAGGASLHRNFRSYGFVLAGYTAAIVALPVVNHPQNVFDSAVMRVSEVMLGILVAGVVSDALFPQRLGDVLREGIRAQFVNFIAFVRDSLRGALPRGDLEKAHLRFVREVVQIENQRSSVVFEDAGVRLRSPRLRLLNHAFMASSTSYQSLHHLLNRLQDAAHAPVRERLMTLAGELAEALAPVESAPRMAAQAAELAARLQALRTRQPAHVRELREGLTTRSDRLDFDTGAELLTRITGELRDYANAYVAMASPHAVRAPSEATAPFSHANDWAGASVAVVRATLTMLAMGAFWLASAWPEGAGAMLIGTIFSGLMATVPDPLRAIRYMLVGYALGIVAGIVCVYGVLIRMDGFALFAAGLIPFLLPGFYLSARPAWPGVGAGYLLALLYTIAAKNPMQYDALHAINDSLSQLIGVGCAGVAFMLFAGTSDSPWLLRRLLAKLRHQLVQACRLPLRGLLPRFESASRDVAAQIVTHTRGGSDRSRELLGWSLAVQETGRAVIELRLALAAVDVPVALRARIEEALVALSDLYAEPGRQRYRAARDRISVALDEAKPYPPLMAQLHLIRLALLDAGSALAEYVEPPPNKETPHAA